jgi:hypothetical protein
MAASSIYIANLALSNLGISTSIQSFDEKTAEAKAVNLFYPQALEACLETYDWSFARVRAALALSSLAPSEDWAFRYVYPANCVKLRKIEQFSRQSDAYPYTVEVDENGERCVLTNIALARVVYTFRQSQAGVYTPHFVEFLAYMLASKMAVRLTAKRALLESNLELAGRALRTAAAYDAGESVEEAPRESEMIRERG